MTSPAQSTSPDPGRAIRDFRDFNNVAPDVAFGFESMPGHQKDGSRGGYSTSAFGGTFGGVGVYAAKVGGLWDEMLGEGRRWWLFASSGFHDTAGDFWPGEYQKTHTYVADRRSPQAIVDGLRPGRRGRALAPATGALSERSPQPGPSPGISWKRERCRACW